MENKTKKAVILIAVILALVIGIKACIKEEVIPEAITAAEGVFPSDLLGLKQEVYSFKIEGFTKDKKDKWILEGESANVVDDKVNITNMKAVYRADDMIFTLSSDFATYDKNTQAVVLEKNIIGRTSDGGELITDYAKWNAKTEEIKTDSYVTIKRENITCRGKGAVTKPKLKHVSLLKEIDVDIAPDRNITCDGPFTLNHEKSVAIFNNNVKIKDKDSDTFTDKLTVYLDPKTNKILRVATEGNVEIVHRGNPEEIGAISF